jgi:RNAse (barnase) inhibitor barstar
VNTTGAAGRGKRRLVRGAAGELYYTADHYRSFVRIDAAPGESTMATGFSEVSAPFIGSGLARSRPSELTIDAAGVHDKAGFMTLLARVLALPDYFGANWDALEECMADMQAAGTAPKHLILRNTAALNGADPRVLPSFAEIVRDAGGAMAVTIE